LPSLPGNGGSGFTFAPVTTIDARGSPVFEQRIGRMLAQRDAELARQFKKMVPSIGCNFQQRGVS